MLIAFAVEFFCKVFSKEVVQEVIGIMLSMNGAILGLVIAGFAFSNAIPKSLMAFFASTKSEDYPWSNYKQILLNYFYCYVSLFSGITLLIFMYLLSFIKLEEIVFLEDELKNYLKALYFSLIWLVQGFILTELKIFLFWIYENSILLGSSVAIDENKKPFDDGNA